MGGHRVASRCYVELHECYSDQDNAASYQNEENSVLNVEGSVDIDIKAQSVALARFGRCKPFTIDPSFIDSQLRLQLVMSTFFQNITSPEAHGGFTQAQPYSILLAIILGTLAIRHWLLHLPKTAKFPLFNPVKGVNLTDIAQRRHFAAHGAQILKEAETANPDRPFNIMTDTGEITVLPAMMADKLRNDPNLNFLTLAVEDTHSNLSGFEAFATLREEQLFLTVINKHLTKHLSMDILLESSFPGS